MQKSNQTHKIELLVASDSSGNRSTYGSTKGHSKPGTGGKHAGPPPPPQPKK